MTKWITLLAGVLVMHLGFAEVPMPNLPAPAHGSSCVQDPAWMKKNHMDLLNHDRDKTMRLGERGKEVKGSIKACINCHVTPDKKGNYPAITSSEHFCNACHAYVAVKLDCFECHASKPQEMVNQ
jgi:hypothetical protein